MEDVREQKKLLVAAAKRNHNTAMQVLDVIKHSFDPEEIELLKKQTQDRIKYLLEDASAAENEARLQLETLRGWLTE